jgi:ABC-2 type transport system ATP-binding protein/lipopolysaccharide transport system ATP-binding protein
MTGDVRVRGLSKRYRIYSERRDSLRERFVSRRGSRYEDFWALRDVDLDIPSGQTFGLIGHNGSGKSTLLKLIAGIHRPTEGAVDVRGRVAALLELGAGFHPELTGRENVYLSGAILGLSRRFIDARMDEIVEFAGVSQFFDSPLKVYSSGMAMRLGFAVASHVDADILLVDEAIAVGDEAFQRKCMEHIYRLRKSGTTIVLVSHSMSTVADLCDQALWLDHGSPQEIGPAPSVISSYLTEVNQQEATAEVVSDDGADLPAPNRCGSGEIRIEGIDYVDAAGDVVNTLIAGEACTFRIRFEALEAMDEVTFGVAFDTESGTRIAGPNHGYGPTSVSVRRGPGTAEFHVDELLLQPGRYEITTAVVTRRHAIDHIDGIRDLSVHSDHAVTETGVTRMKGTWRVENH